MRTVYDNEGVVIGLCNDKMTQPQRRRKERALHRLLFMIDKEQKAFDQQCKDFPLHSGVLRSPSKIQNMTREAYQLRSKLGICNDEKLEEFHKRMCDL